MSFYKKLGKNFIAFAVCVFALFLFTPAYANAAEVTVSTEAELLSAIENAGTAETEIIISQDIELTANTVIPSNISISSSDTDDYWIWWCENITVENQGYIDYVQAEGGKLINNGACYAVVCYGGDAQINTYVAESYVYMGTMTVSTEISYVEVLDTGCVVVAEGGSINEISYLGGKIVNNSGKDIELDSSTTIKNGETYEVVSEITISDGKTTENAITGGDISAAGGYTYDAENAEIVITQDNLTVSGLSQGITITASGSAVKTITLDNLTLTGDAAFYQMTDSTSDLTVLIKNNVTVPYFTLAGEAPVTIKGTAGSYLTTYEVTSIYTDLIVEDLIGEATAGIAAGYYASGDLYVKGNCDLKAVCETLYDEDYDEYYSFPGLMAMGKVYFDISENANVIAAGGDAAFWYGENDGDYFEPSTAIFALDGIEFAANNTIVSPSSFKVDKNDFGYYISSNGSSVQSVTIGYKSGSTPVVPVTKYTVTYSDPTFSAAPIDSKEYEAGASVTVLAPKRTEVTSNGKTYHFSGWSYNGKTYYANDKFTMPAGNVTFTAIWNEKETPVLPTEKYTVTYKDSYATAPTDNNEYEAGATVTVLAPSKTEVVKGEDTYVFDGWKYNNKTYKAGDKLTMPASNVVFEAVWNLKSTPVPPVSDAQISGTVTITGFERQYEMTVIVEDDDGNVINAEVTYAGNGVYNYTFNNVPDGEYYLYVESVDADNIFIDDAFIIVEISNGTATTDESLDLKCFVYQLQDVYVAIKPAVDAGFNGKLNYEIALGFILDESDLSYGFWFDPDTFTLDFSEEDYLELDASEVYQYEYAIMVNQSASDANCDDVVYIITFTHDDNGNFYYNVYKDGIKVVENALISGETVIELAFDNRSSDVPPVVTETVIVVNYGDRTVEYTVDEFKSLAMAENQIGWSLNENSSVADFDVNNIPEGTEKVVVYPVFKSVEPTPVVELTIEVRYADGTVVEYTVDEFNALVMAENQIGWSTTSGSTVADFNVEDVAAGTERVVVYPVFKSVEPTPVVELTIEVRYADGTVVKYTVDEFNALVLAENQIGWSTTFGSTVADFDINNVAEGTEDVVLYPVFKQSEPSTDDPITIDPSKPSDDKPIDINPSDPSDPSVPSDDDNYVPVTGDTNVAFAYAVMALLAMSVAVIAYRKKRETV